MTSLIEEVLHSEANLAVLRESRGWCHINHAVSA